jgi:hypothetical protein
VATVIRRRHTSRRQLGSDKRYELLTGVCDYPAESSFYTDMKNTDAAAFISDEMRADWETNREELLKFWASGEDTLGYFEDCKAWHFIHGSHDTLPWAALQFDKRETVKRPEPSMPANSRIYQMHSSFRRGVGLLNSR